jgi:hypothetical protein
MFGFLKDLFKKKTDPAKLEKPKAAETKTFVNMPVSTPLGLGVTIKPVEVPKSNPTISPVVITNTNNKNLIEVWSVKIYPDGKFQGQISSYEPKDAGRTIIRPQSEIGTIYKVRNYIIEDGKYTTDYFPLFFIEKGHMKGNKVLALQKFLNQKYKAKLKENALFDIETETACKKYIGQKVIVAEHYTKLGIKSYESQFSNSNLDELFSKAQEGLAIGQQVYSFGKSFSSAKTPDASPNAEQIAEQERIARERAEQEAKIKAEEEAKKAKNTQITIIVIVAVAVVGVVVWLVFK